MKGAVIKHASQTYATLPLGRLLALCLDPGT
jgi:hypothetical protein